MAKKNLTSKDLQEYQGNYDEQSFWKKLGKVASRAGVKVVYYALVLFYTLADEHTPAKYKAIIAGALGYLILPLDLIPDFLPFSGMADDWGALLAAVTYVSTAITPDIKARAQLKLREWFPGASGPDFGDLQ